MFVEQVAQLLKALPNVVDGVVAWVNDRPEHALQRRTTSSASSTSSRVRWRSTPAQIVGGVLGLLGSVVGGVVLAVHLRPVHLLLRGRRPPVPPLRGDAVPATLPEHGRRGLGRDGAEGRRLRGGPAGPRVHQRQHERDRLPDHRHAVVARARHLDRRRRPVRAHDRHLHRHRPARDRRPAEPRAVDRGGRARVGRALPAGREPHHRAEDQRSSRRRPPRGGVRLRHARHRAVRGGRGAPGHPGQCDAHRAGRDCGTSDTSCVPTSTSRPDHRTPRPSGGGSA